jgi:hypothetical protein
MYKTKWVEVFHFYFVCEGCFKRCQVCRHKPDDDLDCDATDDGIHNVIVIKGFKFTLKGLNNEKGQTPPLT